MEIVDGIAPMIFVVPAEGGKTHANIQPWNLKQNNNNNSIVKTWNFAPAAGGRL